MACEFVRVSDVDWKLSKGLPPERMKRLQASAPYDQLVEALLDGMSLVSIRREKSRDIEGYFRAVVALRVRSSSLDLFYNASSGYRAQYYHAPELGTCANRFALDRLLSKVLRFVDGANKRTCPPAWAEQSLRDDDAKLWPHQGVWLRSAKKADQNLLVARWLAMLDDPDTERRKQARRSRLTPAKESLLEIKGGFLSTKGISLGTFKPKRSKDIHDLGYT